MADGAWRANHNQGCSNCGGGACTGNEPSPVTPMEVMALTQRAKLARVDGTSRIEQAIADIYSPRSASDQNGDPGIESARRRRLQMQ